MGYLWVRELQMNLVLLFMLFVNFWAFHRILFKLSYSSPKSIFIFLFFGPNQLGNRLTIKRQNPKEKQRNIMLYFLYRNTLSCQVHFYILRQFPPLHPFFPTFSLLPFSLLRHPMQDHTLQGCVSLLFFLPQYLANAMGANTSWPYTEHRGPAVYNSLKSRHKELGVASEIPCCALPLSSPFRGVPRVVRSLPTYIQPKNLRIAEI